MVLIKSMDVYKFSMIVYLNTLAWYMIFKKIADNLFDTKSHGVYCSMFKPNKACSSAIYTNL